MNNNKLLIIDLSNFIFRAFYGVKPLFNKNKEQTNAIHGVANMFLNLLKQTHPSHVIIARDSKEKKERKDLFEEYKANRSAMPDELKAQIEPILNMFNLMNVCQLEVSGQEADDVIGTLVKQEKNNFQSIFIASSDKDLMQLIENNVFLFDSMKNLLYNDERVFDKFGVLPKQMIDFLALVGDKSDNVPGIQGIGPKSASKLLTDYNDFDGIYKNIEDINSKGTKERLTINKENGILSKKLVTINQELDLNYDLNWCGTHITFNDELESFLDYYDLSFIKQRILSEN